jgi:diaminobutyrate-2-oxoglutarate transaminase
LSKSLSGFGLPLSIVLLNPALDRWLPGEHNGTFRGNNHAFITATAALETYWRDQHFAQEIAQKSLIVQQQLKAMLDAFQPLTLRVKGRGLMQGIECASGAIADSICRHAFERGLVIETAGNQGQVVKVFCPLTIGEEDLRKGLKILELSFAATMSEYVARKTA